MMEEGKLTETTGKKPVSGQNGQLELDFPPTENEKEQEAVIEAVLFTMGRSVELRQLAAAIGQNQETARKAVERLMARYSRSKNCGMQIIVLDDSYQMCTKAKYYENLIRVASTPKKQVLTEVMLETLSIIAYKQPVTKLEIEKIRGVKSDHAVNRLIEYNLVYEVGRMDAPGRPALFATTEEFLRRFGVGSTDDLPTMNPEQAEEIKAEVEEELQLKLEDLAAQSAAESGESEDMDGEEAAMAMAEAAAAAEGPGAATTAESETITDGAEAAAEEPGATTTVESETITDGAEVAAEGPGAATTMEIETATDGAVAAEEAPEAATATDAEDSADPTPTPLTQEELEALELEQEAAYAAELEAAAAAREEKDGDDWY